MLSSAHPGDVSPAVRATLEIVDKLKTGFNRDGPMRVQYDVLQEVLGKGNVDSFISI